MNEKCAGSFRRKFRLSQNFYKKNFNKNKHSLHFNFVKINRQEEKNKTIYFKSLTIIDYRSFSKFQF
jgi:hypothetical protein